MSAVAEVEGFDPKSFTIMKLDLASFQSVRDFVEELKEFKADKPLDRLVCNAAVYQPSLPDAKYTVGSCSEAMPRLVAHGTRGRAVASRAARAGGSSWASLPRACGRAR